MISNRVISFAFGPYYFDKNAASVIDQDAGYWILDTGSMRYSVDFIKEEGRSDFFYQHPASSNQYPDCPIFMQSLYNKGVNTIFQPWISRSEFSACNLFPRCDDPAKTLPKRTTPKLHICL